MDDLTARLASQLADIEDAAPNVHALDCELTMTAGFHGPCTCGWPDRLLADVAAKREIIAKYEGAMLQEPKRPDDDVNRGYILGMNAAVVALLADEPETDRE